MIVNKLGIAALIAIFGNGCAAHTTGQIDTESQVGYSQQHKVEPSEVAPAIIVHIDPQTGQIVTPPATPSAAQVPQTPLETAKPPLPPLQEKSSPVAGGGFMIELDDRFRTPLTATIDADGKVKFEHKRSDQNLKE